MSTFVGVLPTLSVNVMMFAGEVDPGEVEGKSISVFEGVK